MRRWLRLATGCLIALAAQTTHGLPALAHAVVVEITPADGSQLSESPAEVVVTFSEPILEEHLEVDIVASSHDRITPESVALDPADAARLIVVLPELDDSTYQVRVTARDRADLHEVIARTTFSVGVAAPDPSPPVLAGALPLEASARWLFATGLSMAVGALVLATRWPHASITRPDRLRRWTIAGIGALVIGRLAVIVARAIDLGGGSARAWSTVLRTSDVVRLPGIVLAAACVAMALLRRGPMWLDAPVRDGGRLTLRHTIGWAGCIWLALLAAWGDHSALTGSVEPSVALAKAVHLLGVATWVGSLGAAIVSNRRADMRAAIVSVQGPAFLGAALAVSSGLLLSSRLIVSLTALLSSQYGVLLVVKLGIAVVAVGMGLAARRRRESRWRAELALLGVVVAVGAAMATSSPPIDRAFLADDQPDVRTWSVDADDLLVQTQAIPGRPGTNSVRVHISDTRRPAPAPLVFATLRTPDGSVHRAAIEDGLAFFDGVELANGESGLQLDIERDDWPLTTADVSIDVQPAAYHFPVRLSAEAIGPALRATGYVGVGAALAVIWTPMSVRSRRRALVEGTTCDEDSEPSLR